MQIIRVLGNLLLGFILGCSDVPQVTDKPSVPDVEQPDQTADLSPLPEEPRLLELYIEPERMVLQRGQRRQLVALARPSRAQPLSPWVGEATWSVATHSESVSIDEDGWVEALEIGRSQISVQVQGLEASARVEVVEAPLGLELRPASLVLPVQGTAQLELVGVQTGQEVVWRSTRTEVVQVDESGQLFAIGPGQAQIIVQVGAEEVSAQISVKGIGSIRIEPAALSMVPVDDTAQLHISLFDTDGHLLPSAGLQPAWSTSTPELVHIDEHGLLTAKEPGRARIRAVLLNFHDSIELEFLLKFKNIECKFHTCCGILEREKSTYCWGEGQDTRNGQWAMKPQRVHTPEPLVSLSLGIFYQCGLTREGRAYCWGDNYTGALGDGTVIPKTHPVPVAQNLRFSKLAAGFYSTCGVQQGTGHLLCWGSWPIGHHDDTVPYRPLLTERVGPDGFRATPHVVADGPFVDLRLDRVLCVKDTQDVWSCMGRLSDGAQCNGQITASPHYAFFVPATTELIPIPDSHTFHGLALSRVANCSLDHNHEVQCCGMNLSGQLGHERTFPYNSNLPQRFSLPTRTIWDNKYVEIISSDSDIFCGVTSDREIECWGLNNYGQLTHEPDPDLYFTIEPLRLNNLPKDWRELTIGRLFGCVLDIQSDVWCWGASPDKKPSQPRIGDPLHIYPTRLLSY
jgi:hypothetical protein